MIYINNCKLLIINRCKDIKKYQLLNYSPLLIPPTTPTAPTAPTSPTAPTALITPIAPTAPTAITPPISARAAPIPPSFSQSLRDSLVNLN